MARVQAMGIIHSCEAQISLGVKLLLPLHIYDRRYYGGSYSKQHLLLWSLTQFYACLMLDCMQFLQHPGTKGAVSLESVQ